MQWMHWMQWTAWMQCRSECFGKGSSRCRGPWLKYRWKILETIWWNLCVPFPLIVSSYPPNKQENFCKIIGAAGVLPYQCKSNAGWHCQFLGLASQQTGLLWQKCCEQQRISIMARLLTSDLLIPFNHIGFLNWNRLGKWLAIKM